MRRLLSTTLGTALTALLVLPGHAQAHSGLSRADPGPGETAQAGVDRIEMDFAGDLAGSAKVEVRDSAGTNLVSGSPDVSGNHLSVRMEPLKQGLHTVKYTITFDDGHTTGGGYYLNVAPAPRGAEGASLMPWFYAVGGGVIAVLLGTIIALLLRRPSEE
ncbi:copper resistance CopC family protein [Saccharopolyspora griseoalba]|uniref:Copper resistance CopC family protein n=1 Tax=Saccharopolyspora griseoalba TaxID=1431848 RepID=A0ABW2LJ13_9PSEU